MPSGIILKSASHEVSDEVREKNLQAVVEGAGYEVAPKEVPAEPVRDDFKNEEEFEAAHVEWQEKQPEPKEEEEEEIQATAPAKKPSRKERAVARATQELQKELRETKERLAALEGKKETKEEAKETPRPKRADFADDEKYEDALLAWGAQKAVADQKLQEAEKANKQRFEENVQNYAAQVEEAKDEYEDWDDVVNQEIFIGREVQLAILEQENGARVIYYLGKHPAYAKKLGEMSPLSAVMEVGRLSARLKTGAAAPAEANGEDRKAKPKVPAPVRTVSTAGSSSALTFAELAQKQNYPGKARDLRRAMAAGE